MEVRALSCKNVRIAPRKVRLVLDGSRAARWTRRCRILRTLPQPIGAQGREDRAVGRGERGEQLQPGPGRPARSSGPTRTRARAAALPRRLARSREAVTRSATATSPSSWRTRGSSMGHKVHPIGFRARHPLRTGSASGSPTRNYTELLHEDLEHPQLDPRRRLPDAGDLARRARAQREPGHRDHPHGQAGHRHRPRRPEGRRAARRAARSATEPPRPRQHPGDPPAGARCLPGGAQRSPTSSSGAWPSAAR